jgi:ATP phosphoribosyltransferase regulatory subunit
MIRQDRWLLPDGIEECLPAEARRLEAARRQVLDLFERWGYELVMPPLIEFLEALLTGTGGDLELQTFKLTDQLSGRLMGVRPDMTPQAARIDAHYLKRETPVRLCYIGPVLRALPEEPGGTREPLQLGAELFGYAGIAAEAEILSLMISTLRLLGVHHAHIDLGHVGIFRALAADAGLSPEVEADLFEALQRKARAEVAALLEETGGGVVPTAARERLLALLELNGEAAEVLAEARRRLAAAPPAVGRALDDLERLAERIAREPDAPALYFDLAEVSGYRYYTGATFSAFVPGHGRAVAKGGRYDGIGRAFGRARPATGFGADLRALLRLSEPWPATASAAPNAAPPRGILAPDDTDPALYAEIARLRAAGERVVAQLPDDGATPGDYGCDRRLVKRGGRWLVETLS